FADNLPSSGWSNDVGFYCLESIQKPILVQHISPRQPPSSDSGSKANGDAVVVVTFWLLRTQPSCR
ncbi:hypothetical protein K443DRAFT_112409, partial [Laccaria amethystina LaAM-08-1]